MTTLATRLGVLLALLHRLRRAPPRAGGRGRQAEACGAFKTTSRGERFSTPTPRSARRRRASSSRSRPHFDDMWNEVHRRDRGEDAAGHRGARRRRAGAAGQSRAALRPPPGRLVAAAIKELARSCPTARRRGEVRRQVLPVPHYAIPLVLFYRFGHPRQGRRRAAGHLEASRKVSEKVKKGRPARTSPTLPWNRTGDGYDPAMSLLWSYGAAWVDKSGKFQGIPKARAEALQGVTRALPRRQDRRLRLSLVVGRPPTTRRSCRQDHVHAPTGRASCSRRSRPSTRC